MRKFKLIFYGIYACFFLICAFIALNHENLVLYWDWDPIDTWVGLMKIVLKLGGIGTILFGVSIFVENIHIRQLRKQISEQEKKLQSDKNVVDK